MAWGLYILAVLAAFVVQSAVVPRFEIDALDALNLLLILALVGGLVATPTDARLGGWLAGFAIDLGTDGPIGLHALVYGLMILALTAVRSTVNLGVWWARALIALLVAFPAQLLLAIHARYMMDQHLTWGRMIQQSLMTAVLAAVVAALLLSLPALFGRRPRRRPLPRRW